MSVSRDRDRSRCRMPAEWEPHRATWIAWPHHEPDWPGKLGPIPWVYAEIARVLAAHEPVEILCHVGRGARVGARRRSTRTASALDRVRLHVVPDRSRLAARLGADRRASTRRATSCCSNWAFNALGEVRQLAAGRRASARAIAAHHRPAAATSRCAPTPASGSCSRAAASRSTAQGLLLVTEEWLLSDVQVRNPGLDARRLRAAVRASGSASARRSGSARAASATTRTATSTTSRGSSSRDTVVLAVEDDPADENHARSMDNLRRLERRAAAPASARCASSRCRFRAPVDR